MEKINTEKKYKILNWVSYFVLCLSLVAKDYFSINATLNTFPLISDVDMNPVLVFMMYALLNGLFVEFLSRFVCNTVMRVSFSDINKDKFVSVFKFIVVTANILVSFFNFMYFIMPYTFRLHSIIEIVSMAIVFSIIFAIIYKKYLNKKSAPVVFLSLAIPLGLYFVMIAIGG